MALNQANVEEAKESDAVLLEVELNYVKVHLKTIKSVCWTFFLFITIVAQVLELTKLQRSVHLYKICYDCSKSDQ